MVMRHGGGRGAIKCFAERSLWAAKPHEGASEPAVDTCCLSPVWNTGSFAAMNSARLCRSKTIRPTQLYQHSSMTEPSEIKLKDW